MGQTELQGLALDDFAYCVMSEREKRFWLAFTELMDGEIGVKLKAGLAQPFTPSAELAIKYRVALTCFDGRAYLLVKEAEKIFKFPPNSILKF
jgi:hypothetical protein